MNVRDKVIELIEFLDEWLLLLKKKYKKPTPCDDMGFYGSALMNFERLGNDIFISIKNAYTTENSKKCVQILCSDVNSVEGEDIGMFFGNGEVVFLDVVGNELEIKVRWDNFQGSDPFNFVHILTYIITCKKIEIKILPTQMA